MNALTKLGVDRSRRRADQSRGDNRAKRVTVTPALCSSDRAICVDRFKKESTGVRFPNGDVKVLCSSVDIIVLGRLVVVVLAPAHDLVLLPARVLTMSL